MERQIRERSLIATKLLIDGSPVDPWIVSVSLGLHPGKLHSLELHLGVAVLVDEMQHCGVQVTEETARDFVDNDIAKFGSVALQGYLRLACAMISPAPARKSTSWLARMFTRPPKWDPPKHQWVWVGLQGVRSINSGALVIDGMCSRKSDPS
jgi:hypothetical protein